MKTCVAPQTGKVNAHFDWLQIARWVLTSRAMDALEELELYPQKKIPYQFSARGHDLSQVLLGSLLTHKHDGAGAYYRSRPFLLTLGMTVDEGLAASLARSGGFSDGRDIGAVCNFPSRGRATVLPMAGEVGSQYTGCAGWAQALVYRREVLREPAYESAIAVALGGDGSVATNGFWSALTIATTLKLPLLFYIEDNGYSLSVPGALQTPGANIARNLASFAGLNIFDGDGTDPAEAATLTREAVAHVRGRRGPALLRLTVPRLEGHSFQDTQAYKSKETLEAEWKRDPLPKLKAHLAPSLLSDADWDALEAEAKERV